MAIAILVGRDEKEKKEYEWFITHWKKALLNLDPHLDIRVWPDIDCLPEIEFALVWKHPLGVLNKFTNLKAIASLAAGVDHVIADPDLIPSIPLVRVIDSYMANDILQYVIVCTLSYIKRMDHWLVKQQQKVWYKQPPFSFAEKTIGVMGLGFLGSKVAYTLQQMGLHVIGWSNSPKEIRGVKDYVGKANFIEFLSKTGILICMLPLTYATKNILCADTFSHLPKGSFLINVGRGEHLVENDLLEALANGHISGAYLDVFQEEPLPVEHPFWDHPNIKITPHIASVTNPTTAAPQIIENYQRLIAGKTLLNPVDLTKGY